MMTWIKENRKDVARKLAGTLVWFSKEWDHMWGCAHGTGNTYRREETKKTKAERKARKHDRVMLVKARGGRHVMHMLHAIQKAAPRQGVES